MIDVTVPADHGVELKEYGKLEKTIWSNTYTFKISMIFQKIVIFSVDTQAIIFDAKEFNQQTFILYIGWYKHCEIKKMRILNVTVAYSFNSTPWLM